jgi:predicted small secreted protein
MRAILSAAAFVAVTACNQTGGAGYDYGSYGAHRGPGVNIADTLLTTDAREYVSGGIVTVRLTNRSGRALERLDGEGEWRPALTTLAEVCTAEIRTLRPGQAVTYSFKAAPRGPRASGDFRVSADLEDLQANTRFVAVSNTFKLTRDSD